MNIDEFRAMKVKMQEDEKKPEGHEEAPTDETSTTTEDVEPEDNKEEESNPEDLVPQTFEIDGQEVTLEELKGGYLRQSDYTRKTQEVKRQEAKAQEALDLLAQLEKNPDLSEELGKHVELPNLDPKAREFSELESKYFDLLIDNQIKDLTAKYGEFDVAEVLNTARDSNIEDLDTAYHVVKSRKGGGSSETVDQEKLKEQLREELLAELKSEQVDTGSVIGSGGGSKVVNTSEPKLSTQESKVARMMGLGKKEYAKWRDAK